LLASERRVLAVSVGRNPWLLIFSVITYSSAKGAFMAAYRLATR
jgi:hypothetical protein